MSDVIDATVVEELEPVEVAPVESAPSVAVARRERRSEVIRPLDPEQLVDSFQQYQDLLPKLLVKSDYQDAGKDKHGNQRRFVKKSGWRKIATAFDLDVQIIRSTVDRDDAGQPLRAEVWARAIAPSGRLMDGDGYCSVDEDRFDNPKARLKLENDLRATATTRAMNRAISGLVGMGDVSAEEIDGGGQSGPEHGPVVSDDVRSRASTALTLLLSSEDAARHCWTAIQKQLGYMPDAVGRALILVGEYAGSGEIEL